MISVIVPTFNEEENICELVPHILECEHGEDLEIIICDAPISSDNGLQRAEQLGVKALQSPKAYRAYQMNYGAKHASNDILYFLHADARPPKDFAAKILLALETVDFGIFSYRFNSKSLFLKMNAFFTRYDGLFAGGGDQSLFIRRNSFEHLGGFDNNLMIMEDFNFYRRAKKARMKFAIVKEPLLVSARKYEKNSWLKVNLINLSIFVIYKMNGSQDRMIALNSKLSRPKS